MLYSKPQLKTFENVGGCEKDRSEHRSEPVDHGERTCPSCIRRVSWRLTLCQLPRDGRRQEILVLCQCGVLRWILFRRRTIKRGAGLMVVGPGTTLGCRTSPTRWFWSASAATVTTRCTTSWTTLEMGGGSPTTGRWSYGRSSTRRPSSLYEVGPEVHDVI